VHITYLRKVGGSIMLAVPPALLDVLHLTAGTTGVIRCDQLCSLDMGSHHGRKLESVPTVIMDEVLAKLAAIRE